jgi:hypothetical protein
LLQGVIGAVVKRAANAKLHPCRSRTAGKQHTHRSDFVRVLLLVAYSAWQRTLGQQAAITSD